MTTPSNSPYTPDLRGFIEFLEKEHPEQVVRISREVDPMRIRTDSYASFASESTKSQ